LQADSPAVYIDFALRGMLLSLLTLLVLLLWKDRRRAPLVLCGCFLALGMLVYVIQTAPFFQRFAPRMVEISLVAVSNGNSSLFWFFALALFDDEFRWRRWQLIVWIVVVIFAALTLMTHDLSRALSLTDLHDWAHPVLAWLPMVFGGLTMFAALKHWRADLVEQRRWLRAFIVVTGFLYLLGTGFARLDTASGRFATISSMFDMIALGAIVFVIAWRLVVLDGSALFPPEAGKGVGNLPFAPGPQSSVSEALGLTLSGQAQTPDAANSDLASHPDEQQLAEALKQLMSHDRAYREENMTIHRLAAKLKVPEYKLRRLINQRMGYRNFSAFLNAHRLEQVTADLADSKRGQLPILTLALDAGFQSIGPFNRAFKSRFGMTPTEFRLKHRADFENG
jgi:AraC-like DNA-binding protein